MAASHVSSTSPGQVRPRWWAEVALVCGVLVAYLVAPSAEVGADRLVRANEAADLVVRAERLFGLAWEAALQDAALHHRWLVVAANLVYGSLHFLVTPAVLVFLFFRRPHAYDRWRTTLAVASLLAFGVATAWPVAPPRLAGGAGGGALLVDTLSTHPTLWSFESGFIEGAANPVAAVPSMHAGWALWCALAVGSGLRPAPRVLCLAYPALVTVTIVVTGNHFLLDAVAGFAVVGVGWCAAVGIDRVRARAGSSRTPTAASGGALHRRPGATPPHLGWVPPLVAGEGTGHATERGAAHVVRAHGPQGDRGRRAVPQLAGAGGDALRPP